MNRLTIDKCPLCKGEKFSLHQVCTDYYASNERFEIWHCDGCGFTFTQNVPNEEEIGRYYESPDYISHSNTRQGIMNRVYHLARQWQLKKKARLVKRESGRQTGNLLDIGTGTGYFPHTMAQEGWSVSAIEKSEEARTFAKQHFGLDVKPANTLNEFTTGHFHAITLWHVMEHIEDLDELWQNLYRLLADNGVLIIAVPNHQSYDASHYGNYWAAYDVPRHLWHFTPETIKLWGEKHGFKLSGKYPMPLDAFYVSMLSEKYQGKKAHFIRGLYTGSIAYVHSLRKKELSSSLIYIFHKSSQE